jgi:hypothetical protein
MISLGIRKKIESQGIVAHDSAPLSVLSGYLTVLLYLSVVCDRALHFSSCQLVS